MTNNEIKLIKVKKKNLNGLFSAVLLSNCIKLVLSNKWFCLRNQFFSN